MKLVIKLSVGLGRTYIRQLTCMCTRDVWMWQGQVFTDLSSISSILNKAFWRSLLASGCLRLPQALQAHTLSLPLSHLRQKRQRVSDVRFFKITIGRSHYFLLSVILRSHSVIIDYFPTLK